MRWICQSVLLINVRGWLWPLPSRNSSEYMQPLHTNVHSAVQWCTRPLSSLVFVEQHESILKRRHLRATIEDRCTRACVKLPRDFTWSPSGQSNHVHSFRCQRFTIIIVRVPNLYFGSRFGSRCQRFTIITIHILGCLLDPPTLERLSFLMNLLNLFSNRCHHLTFDSRLLVTNACRLSDQFTSTASVMMNIDHLIPMKKLGTDQYTSSKYHSL